MTAAVLFAVPPLVLAFYHTVCFGRPWYTGYRYQYHFFELMQAGVIATHPLWSGIQMLLFRFPGPAYPLGLFVLHPVLVLSFWGWALMGRWKAREVLCQILMVLVVLWAAAKFIDPGGGSSGDPRYLSPILPLMFIPLGAWVDWCLGRIRDERWKVLAMSGFGVLVFLGSLACFVHFAEFHGHDLNFRRDIPHYSLISKEAFLAITERVFVSAQLLPWFYVALGALAAFGWFTKVVIGSALRLAESVRVEPARKS